MKRRLWGAQGLKEGEQHGRAAVAVLVALVAGSREFVKVRLLNKEPWSRLAHHTAASHCPRVSGHWGHWALGQTQPTVSSAH